MAGTDSQPIVIDPESYDEWRRSSFGPESGPSRSVSLGGSSADRRDFEEIASGELRDLTGAVAALAQRSAMVIDRIDELDDRIKNLKDALEVRLAELEAWRREWPVVGSLPAVREPEDPPGAVVPGRSDTSWPMGHNPWVDCYGPFHGPLLAREVLGPELDHVSDSHDEFVPESEFGGPRAPGFEDDVDGFDESDRDDFPEDDRDYGDDFPVYIPEELHEPWESHYDRYDGGERM